MSHLTEETIGEALDKEGLRYLKASDGFFVVRYADRSGPFADFFLSVEAKMRFVLRALSTRRRTVNGLHDVALEICNKWNSERPFMRAYVERLDDTLSSPEIVVLEADCLVLPHSRAEETVRLMIRASTALAHEFFEALHDQVGTS